MPSMIESIALDLLNVMHEIKTLPCSETDTQQILSRLGELLDKYLEVKRKLRIEFINWENAVVTIENDEARKLILDIISPNGTSIDAIVRCICREQGMDDESLEQALGNSIEIEPMGEEVFDHLLSWFNPGDYIKGIYEIGGIVLGTDRIPSFLRSYMAEARECYGFGKYLSVISLSRTILEISLHDMNRKIWERVRHAPLPEQESRMGNMREVVDELFDQDTLLKREAHVLITQMNKVAHGNLYLQGASALDAKSIFKQTVDLIHRMYSKLGL